MADIAASVLARLKNGCKGERKMECKDILNLIAIIENTESDIQA